MAAPAEPILASAIWATNEVPTHESLEMFDRTAINGYPNTDSTFGRALQYGKMCCVSMEPQSGGRELCEAYVASHLLSSSDATATIIDTGLSFDVRRFHRTLLARLEGTSGAEQQALSMLDRLKIMKVFDFEGLTESLAELRDAMDGRNSSIHVPGVGDSAPTDTINDSEDDEEMLLPPSPPPKQRLEPADCSSSDQRLSKSIILIDSISHVAAPSIRNRHAQGQGFLMSFMRSLAHLTMTHRLCTILINDAIPKAHIKDESPSIFTTCAVRPALGRSFEHVLDTHLLVHCAPAKTVRSVVDQSTSRAGDYNADNVSVVEILQDRDGNGLGRWSAFTVVEGGKVQDFAGGTAPTAIASSSG